jgi:hypothetical protein
MPSGVRLFVVWLEAHIIVSKYSIINHLIYTFSSMYRLVTDIPETTDASFGKRFNSLSASVLFKLLKAKDTGRQGFYDTII